MSKTGAKGKAKKPTPEPLLELKPQISPDGQVAAFVPVRWCVHKPILDAVRNFRNPHVLIVVRGESSERFGDKVFHDYTDTDLYVAPLKAEMQFVAFRRPGKNQICAAIIDMSDRNTVKAVRTLRRRVRDRFFGESLFEENGSPGYSLRSVLSPLVATPEAMETIKVPAEMFAKEPPAWVSKLVSVFFDSKGRDQCGFRNRVIWSVLFSIPGVPFTYAWKLLYAAFCLFIGCWPAKEDLKKNLDYLVRPFMSSDLFTAAKHYRRSMWWLKRARTDDYWDPPKFRLSPLNIINPPVLLIPGSLACGIMNLPVHHYHTVVNGHSHGHHTAWYPISWVTTMEWTDGILVGFVLAVAAAVGVFLALGAIIGLVAKTVPQINAIMVPFQRLEQFRQNAIESARRSRAEAEKERQKQLEAALAAMTCRSEAAVVDVSALPKEKQTVSLRFNDFKQKVCKPFAV